ncbi:MAG TPA: EscU/YscU/HrcU family type III secretion system export apparatus switch protein [Leptospiraceae bacterium]|nr:EscU/YscU/HrcU family type III secretion system export apparatus switch protein [Leptospiraceae bacterium]HMW04620.1 EscU/YscU/HrcU family type III secretion system export apparatus switch protein [Leptospiraceae bacterium]HMX31659.1 EscU/YscU/HrcU family type III secretion system export apparatus switch protein [Leptospiraceae bacterium]HMY30456.1 EscU/YscU/HrcU family type III secretion system export apparatus switch protein [Leptospiraceae bacterium]HMZ67042.1 EscU/YscU/HrcU family type I
MNAVALKFIPEKDNAPRVIASGSGFLGDKIHQIAELNQVPILQDETLASSLLQVPVGKEIPEALYKSVAVVFSFLYKLENELKSRQA